MKAYNSSEEMYTDMEYKVETLTKALNNLLLAVSWDDVQEVGGEPLSEAIEEANLALSAVEDEEEK